jgi:hypothetical protein
MPYVPAMGPQGLTKNVGRRFQEPGGANQRIGIVFLVVQTMPELRAAYSTPIR